MIPGDRAFYPGTDVLQNKLDIRDGAKATTTEYSFAMARQAELRSMPAKGPLNFDRLKEIHRHLFQDMYEWAGQERSLNFAKRNPSTGYVNRFTPIDKIPEKAKELDAYLAQRNFLKGLEKPEFIRELTEVYAQLNELHPFREGNGRSTRVFLTEVAEQAGYQIDMTKIEGARWNNAAALTMPQHHAREPGVVLPKKVMEMRQIFHDAVSPLVIEKPLEAAVPAPAGDQTKTSHAPIRTAADAFDKLPVAQAYERFPELRGAFQVLAKAKQMAEQKLKAPQDRVAFMQQARIQISERLHQGKMVNPTYSAEHGRYAPDPGRER